jgi:hypothetical protein
LGSIKQLTQDVHTKLNAGIVTAKAAFNRKTTLFTSKLDFHLRNKFRAQHCMMLRLAHLEKNRNNSKDLKCGAAEG